MMTKASATLEVGHCEALINCFSGIDLLSADKHSIIEVADKSSGTRDDLKINLNGIEIILAKFPEFGISLMNLRYKGV